MSAPGTFGPILARMDQEKDFRGWDLSQTGKKLSVHIVNKWPENALRVETKNDVVKAGDVLVRLESEVEAAALAENLLDRELFGKIESISPKSYGDPNDHLPAGVEEVGQIPGPNGPEPVRLVRRHLPEGARWIFSRATSGCSKLTASTLMRAK